MSIVDKEFYEPKIWSHDHIVTILESLKNNINNFHHNNHTYETSMRKYIDDTTIFNINDVANDILSNLPTYISTNQLYYYMSDYFAGKIKDHVVFDKLSSFMAVKRLHCTTTDNYLDVVNTAYHNTYGSMISRELYITVLENAQKIQNKLDYSRDYFLDFFGIRTLERSYLAKVQQIKSDINMKAFDNDSDNIIIERPQHLFMRVALAIWSNDLDKAFETYDNLSYKFMTHATPTLFNCGTNQQQMSSCFLLGAGDSIEGIAQLLTNIMSISKWAGGIGIHLTAIRARGSLIRKTNGRSDGIVPLCVVLEKLGRYVNQGGKRNGSIAVYMEPWHADVVDFIELRQPNGDENNRARDLFLALWVPDIFMKRVQENGKWSLMCPDTCQGLVSSHGKEFEELYLKYEKEGKYVKQINAVDLWTKIIECQIQTGMPYMLFKDNANNKSNQQNLGTIRSSNLCAEIIEHSDDDSIAVCNLASICLPQFIKTDNSGVKSYDYDKLIYISKQCTRNLNKIIDINYYPVQATKTSNFRHRPIGIGVQGLADVFNIFGYPYGSSEAKDLNKRIFETIYYGALYESCEIAKKDGHYESFKDSPFSHGKLQYHLWGLNESDLLMGFDWEALVNDIKTYGTRNSLLTALMPTATTSQIMGNSEAFEPYHTNIFLRQTLAGEFIVVNKHLMNDLIKDGIWNDNIRKKIIIDSGSVQNIKEIPQKYKDIYKTAFEVKLKDLIDLSADRGVFIDQSQSLNLFLAESDRNKIHSCHFHSWKRGLKTGMYYLRSKPSSDPINFGIDVEELKLLKNDINSNSNNSINISNNSPNDSSTNGSIIEHKEPEPNVILPKVCKFIRGGMKLEDCLMCSS